MARKIKTITIVSGHLNDIKDPTWRVERITDSIEYTPDQFLDKKAVTYLCESKEWKVTIVGKKY